jgi:crotonobetaine/carnitine-CoA ligase
VPSEISEDEIKAYVVPKQGQRIEVEALVRYLDSILPYFMVPRYNEFLNVMPKTATEKVKKGMIKEKDLQNRRLV